MAASVKDSAWLDWIASLMGAASRQTLTAMLPPQEFHCLLDELPLHLIPQSFLNREYWRQQLSQPLYLNPNCVVLPPGRVPQDLQAPASLEERHLLEGFNLQSSIAWVRDPATGSIHPFWLGPRLAATVSQLSTLGPVSSSLPEKVRLVLAQAGILTPAGYSDRRMAEWSEIVAKQGPTFREKDYLPLGKLIHPFNLAALRRYYRYAIRRGRLWLGDGQSGRRYVAHNEPVLRYFHHQIAPAVSALVGEPVKPSYVYLASYLSGAELKKHTDREQCEFSVTLCLDFSPEPVGATSWPLHLETPQGTVTVYQGLGDGLIYRGTKVPHYRSVLRAGYTSTSIFFHYVPADFTGPLD